MQRSRRIFGLALLALASAASSGRGAGGAVAACTFANPAYSGSCVVREAIPAGRSAAAVCARVLECLNDTTCSGKNYCNSTELRGGWVLKSAKEVTK
jgi:hypothetical protein